LPNCLKLCFSQSYQTLVFRIRDKYFERVGRERRLRLHRYLMDGNEKASDGAFWTWVRQTFPQLAERYNSSDLSKSKIVIVWEIK
jgi:hypothetical protein